MKKLIATLMALTLVITVAATAALAEESVQWVFRGGVEFDMDMEQVMELENRPKYEIESEKTRGTVEFYELEYEDIVEEGIKYDLKYLFVGNSLVAIHYDFDDGVSYDTIKGKLAAYGEAVPFDAAAIGNGKYAVDDDGDLKDCVEMINAGDGLIIVLERDKDGDVDVTFVNVNAAYINA